MIFDLQTQLNRTQRLDVLSALTGQKRSDDSSLNGLALFDELTDVLLANLEAPRGQLVETLRRRLVEVGDALDALAYGGIEPFDELTSWDQVTDQQLIWAIGNRIINEVAAIDNGGNDGLAEDLGRRVLAHPGPVRQQLMMRIEAAGDLGHEARSPDEHRATIDRVLAGDPHAVLLDPAERPSRSLVAGVWVCDRLGRGLSTVLDQRQRTGEPVPDNTVYAAGPAAGELLAAWLGSEDTLAADGTVVPGFKGMSSRTKARKARSARTAAILAVAARAYMTEPDAPFNV